jgi:hypothetical protein
MAVGRAQRRAERAARFGEAFGKKARVALDLVEVMEYAWHDCYDEITPPDEVIDDLLVCAQGSIETLIRAVHLGITDWRDLRMWADGVRNESGGS